MKIQEVLSLNWNDLEKTHLEKILEFINNNPEIFERDALKNEMIYDKFDRFKYEWIDYATETLGWTRQLIGIIIASGNKLKDKSGVVEITPSTYISTRKVRSESGGGYPDCNCDHTDDWCWGGETL